MRRHLSSRRVALGAALLLLTALPGVARAQGTLRPFDDGSGLVAGAPVKPVSNEVLHTGAINTVNLHPRYHTTLEFPMGIKRVDAGDTDVFTATHEGNKLILKASRVTLSETSMTVILDDAEQTLVPFFVRADSTQPVVIVVRYTDPVSEHVNAAESRIASRLNQEVDARVDDLARERELQQAIFAGPVVEINKRAELGRAGERIELFIEQAQVVPSDGGVPLVRLKYRFLNQTLIACDDLRFVVRAEKSERKWGVLAGETRAREIPGVQDVRSHTTIPPGVAVQGVLILEYPDLTTTGESLSVEALVFQGQASLKVDRVLVGG